MLHRVLLFDRDAVSLAAMANVLNRAKCQVSCAQSIDEVLLLSASHRWDAAIIDGLSDQTAGLEALRAVRRTHPAAVCAVTIRFGHESFKAEARRLGAFECIEQPLSPTLLIAVVYAAVASRTGLSMTPGPSDDVVLHALARWADVVVRLTDSQHDPRTLAEWGRAIAVSTGALRNWCRTAGISARRSLAFARVLRAVVTQSRTTAAPGDLLNVVDRRTLEKLLRAAGGVGMSLPKDVSQFLLRQEFVKNSAAILIVSAALEARRHRAGGARTNASDAPGVFDRRSTAAVEQEPPASSTTAAAVR
jgi:DNA-binding NarL/FixJ family response regulator